MDFNWYNSLNKPLFTPAMNLFGPVWGTLYFLIALSLFFYFRKKTKQNKREGYKLFFIQLGLNLIWSPVFFGLHSIIGAMIILAVMWIFIYKTIKAFGKIDKSASILLYPYIAWVTIASLLNLSILLLN